METKFDGPSFIHFLFLDPLIVSITYIGTNPLIYSFTPGILVNHRLFNLNTATLGQVLAQILCSFPVVHICVT